MPEPERIRAALAALRGSRPAREEASPERRGSPPIEHILGGEWRATEDGPAFVRETRLPLSHRHGTVPVGTPLSAPPSALATALGIAAPPCPRGLAFFDTETTGLSGGTGTYIFLAGVGRFEGGEFRIRQYFLPSPDGERTMLAALARDLAAAEGVVTYNGKTFDMPLLQARLTLARIPPPRHAPPHFDLLRAVRRLWRDRLESCRLAEAEARLLGVERKDDVPGHAIPSLYFDYVRAGRAGPLRGVFRHNAQDILSLAGVLGAVADIFTRSDLDPVETLALARWWEAEKDAGRAAELYRCALPGLGDGDRWTAAASRYALILKRSGSREAAADLWRRLWERGSRDAGIELAKWLEHGVRDLEAAEEMTRALLAGASGPERNDLERRFARVARKRRRMGGD